MSAPDAHLAYLFYSGVPWEKLTKAEQKAFERHQRREVSR